MIVFPMSGLSSRFSKAGYLTNKYKLDLYGNSVFHHIVSQFKKADLTDSFVFIHNGNDFDENFISQTCNDLGLKAGEYHIVKLNGNTRGQAETVSKGLEQLKVESDERLFIYNIDSIRIGFSLPEELESLDVDGYLEVFKGEGDHWSFALPKDEKPDKSFLEVAKVAEKERISTYCSNGLYYFKSFKVFKEAYDSEIKNFSGKGELFVAPLYNHLINSQKSIYMREIEKNKTIFCGTPLEYEAIASPSIPIGIVPSEKYISKKILEYTAEGVNQKIYFNVMNTLRSAHEILKSSLVLKAMSVFFNHYGSYARFITYSYIHFSKFKKDKEYIVIYNYLKKILIGLLRNNIDIQNNNQKAINIITVLIIIGGVNTLKKYSQEFRTLAPYITIPDHLILFRVLRHKISDKDLLDLIFDQSNHINSVSYLFLIFCLSYRLEDNDSYIQFIKNNLKNSRVLRKGDNERKDLLTNLLFNTPKLSNDSLHNKKVIKVAVLITGQMRNYNTVSKYFNNLNSKGIDYDVYLSTWDKAGQPQASLSSLRGYDSRIRVLIMRHSNKFSILNEDFVKNYHLNKTNLIVENLLRRSFDNLKWVNIDIEGETTDNFDSNQDRLYFKINQAYKEAAKKDYDAFIRVRPDLNFSLDEPLLAEKIRECASEDNLIYIRNAPLTDMYLPFIDDNFAIASPRAMKAYATLYEVGVAGGDEIPLDPFRKDIRPHSSLGYQLLLNGVNIKFLNQISDWNYNDLGKVSPLEYINYLETLDKVKLNVDYIDSLISELKDVK